MTTPTDSQSLIARAEEVCKGVTPGPCDVVGPTTPATGTAAFAVVASCGPLAEFPVLADAHFFATARTLVPALAEALGRAARDLQTEEEQSARWRRRHFDGQDQISTLKAKQVDLLADAYAKGLAFGKDVDDRTSEHG